MLIDPFIVIAQIINFLILVALLKRFLYKPITQAMEARSQRIERQLATAANTEKEAEAEKELYLQKQQELAAQKQAWLEEAKQEVELEKEQLTQQAQAEVERFRSQWYRTLEQDQHKFARELRDRLSQQVAVTTRKALSDLANANLEIQIIDTFIDQLNDLNDAQLKTIRVAPIPNPHHIITICSSFVIPDHKKEQLLNVIQKQIAANAEVEFETVEDLLCGIELRDRGYKISWNLEHYLTEIEAETAKILTENNNQAA
ncbi:F0F1-type ATP synthase, beta subunit [Xenococcus sp. PCC 7305]|uniref:F0F1 ATP synthase subunit B family protein n=1 Tax=Xenococcus sp. PCC 7305 TaxID=102125 RepID=UPI0002ACDE62|nr:F0F1-type ATP synthase subunit beta [Xenococcus sp. PCC 7305]ELS00775.1 F0F1-type ATP synthase, beta subunit [Xenococcus sp. PCC 7305]